eukprot:10213335-Alexandrium_andersonii.AAC.1
MMLENAPDLTLEGFEDAIDRAPPERPAKRQRAGIMMGYLDPGSALKPDEQLQPRDAGPAIRDKPSFLEEKS